MATELSLRSTRYISCVQPDYEFLNTASLDSTHRISSQIRIPKDSQSSRSFKDLTIFDAPRMMIKSCKISEALFLHTKPTQPTATRRATLGRYVGSSLDFAGVTVGRWSLDRKADHHACMEPPRTRRA